MSKYIYTISKSVHKIFQKNLLYGITKSGFLFKDFCDFENLASFI